MAQPPVVFGADQIREFIAEHFPQAARFPHRIDLVEPGRVVLRWLYTDKGLRPGGTISGPTQFTLADTAMFYLVLAHVGPAGLSVTTDANLHFLRKPKPADLLCDARVVKLGKHLVVGEMKLFSEGEDEPVTIATMTYSLPPGARRAP
ncbi:MAG: PaaI family thioesterase [Myxococcales bacterium]|nr:PaaI family thioesterase [Myxococcales bacterium]